MNPLILLAGTVLPEILKLIASDKTGQLGGTVADAVSKVTGTTNPADAKAALDASPSLSSDLRVELARIALETHQTDLAAEQADDAAANASTASARATLLDLAKANAATAYTPSIISYIVLFSFLILSYLLFSGKVQPALVTDQNKVSNIQLINIIFGTIATGFATVLNFWLGSSLGSRRKDIALTSSAQIQQAQSLPTVKTAAIVAAKPAVPLLASKIAGTAAQNTIQSTTAQIGRAVSAATNIVAGGHTKELEAAKLYAATIIASAQKYGLAPALVCAIGSRESAWGLTLKPPGPAGTGDWVARDPAKWGSSMPPDGKGWGRGLMQIDYQDEFAKSGDWQNPNANIDFGCKEIADNIDFFQKMNKDGSLDFTRAGIASYNCGRGNVIKAIESGLDLDHYTTGHNYSADVMKRVAWFDGKI